MAIHTIGNGLKRDTITERINGEMKHERGAGVMGSMFLEQGSGGEGMIYRTRVLATKLDTLRARVVKDEVMSAKNTSTMYPTFADSAFKLVPLYH